MTGSAVFPLNCPFQVDGSRQWRAVEDQLISPALFAAMRETGPLPIAALATAEEYLAERRALLQRRLSEAAAEAAADRLEDVRIKGDELSGSWKLAQSRYRVFFLDWVQLGPSSSHAHLPLEWGIRWCSPENRVRYSDLRCVL
jgi:hypothetical protein